MLFLKGLLIGIGKILPGVSGSLMAISMNVYEPLLSSISDIFKKPRDSIRFLFPILSGIILSIILFSNVLKILVYKYYFSVLLLFIGLIIGTIDFSFKEFENKRIPKIIIFVFLIIFPIFINTLSVNINISVSFFNNIILGIIEAVSTIIPGISGTAIFIVLKKYELILDMLSNPFNNLDILIPFIIGIIIGVFILSKMITYIIKKHPILFMVIVKAFTLSTLIIMYLNTLKLDKSIIDIIVGEILLVVGCIVSKKINCL